MAFTLDPPANRYIGHRGIAALAPENTLAGFKLASQSKLDWIEFDIRLTKDNQIIVFHDDTLERTTNGQGFVQDYNLTDLIGFDAGSWFHPQFQGEKIPLFSSALTLLLETNLTINIELKFSQNPTDSEVKILSNNALNTLKSVWPKNKPWPLISSFEWSALDYFRKDNPAIPLGYLSTQCDAALIHRVSGIENAALHVDHQHLTSDLMQLSQDLSLPVLAYTVNDPNRAKILIEQGIFGLFTDNPPQE